MARRPGPPSPAQHNPLGPPQILLARDHLRSEITAALREGSWERVRRGAYIETITDEDPFVRRRTRALARVAAVAAVTSSGAVFSHEAAAVLHGLPLLRELESVDLVQTFMSGGQDAPDVQRHVGALAPEHVSRRHGLPVTSLERTIVDCAMALNRRDGLVIADAALHLGADRATCEEILAALSGRRGVVAARWVVARADGGAESPGESRTRFELLRGGCSPPATQIEVQTLLGVFWGDLGWPEHRVLVEYDGVAKYEANGSASRAVLAEKRRQEAIEAAGWIVIRVTAADLRDPTRLLAQVRAALASRRHGPAGQ